MSRHAKIHCDRCGHEEPLTDPEGDMRLGVFPKSPRWAAVFVGEKRFDACPSCWGAWQKEEAAALSRWMETK